jgi:tRNA/tmRNA/rRNA uracil-C5-methylase (TrmA/RlmC/RlmD family)
VDEDRPPAATGVRDQPSWLGQRVEVEVGPVAHGGHCVARHHGRVIFVRHCLPGERVMALITEDRGGSFCRADAVEVLLASPDRVGAPCRYAHPGGCGGCDFQHAAPPAQRRLKAAVVAEQLKRIAGLECAVTVQELSPEAVGWRRRIRFAVADDGRVGLREHRSHRVIEVERCLLGMPGVDRPPSWSGTAASVPLKPDEVEVVRDDHSRTAVLAHHLQRAGEPARPGRNPKDRRRRRPPQRHNRRPPSAIQTTLVSGPDTLAFTVRGAEFAVHPGGFWQAHSAAPDAFVAAVLGAAGLQPGQRALDLYAGAGLFTVFLAQAAGPTGSVIALEVDRRAVDDARGNLAAHPSASVRHAPVSPAALASACEELGPPDVIVLDPPRSGAGPQIIRAILSTGARRVVYVACDPAALARDVAAAGRAGWKLADLTAFDAFPMTHHVECVALLVPA